MLLGRYDLSIDHRGRVPHRLGTVGWVELVGEKRGEGSLEGKILYLFEQVGGKEATFLLRLLQSEGEIAHEYTTVKGAERGTAITRREGLLTVFTSTTQRKVYEDDETRYLSIWIDTSTQQTLEILKAKLRPGGSAEQVPVKVFREAFRIITARAASFSYPKWFDYILTELPLDHLRVRRDWDRFMAFCQAIAVCRSFAGRQRNSKQIKIRFSDYCIAYELLNAAFTATLASRPQQEIEIANAVRKIHSQRNRGVTVTEISESLSWSPDKVYKHLKPAIEHHLVEYEPGTRQRNEKRLLPGRKAHRDFLPSPQKIMNASPEIGERVSYVSPLTGAKTTVRRNTE